MGVVVTKTGFSKGYIGFFSEVLTSLDTDLIDVMADQLLALRQRRGRLFILGVGGSAGNASHAVNDFRKLCGIETYAPTDNVSELTARANDEGWETIFSSWLEVSNITESDAIFVLSVGGGNMERQVSVPIINAVDLASGVGADIFGIVGRDGGYTKKVGRSVFVVPDLYKDLVTPFAESLQAVVWHCLVSHPTLKVNATKW